MVDEVKTSLGTSSQFPGDDGYVRCLAHILNLIVGIYSLTLTAARVTSLKKPVRVCLVEGLSGRSPHLRSCGQSASGSLGVRGAASGGENPAASWGYPRGNPV